MSNANNNQYSPYMREERVFVATYKEIIIGFVVFATILFLLYPKDMLKEQIMNERANYDLSMLYLKNLLKHDPENESLMMMMASKSAAGGKRDLALRLLELLIESPDETTRREAYLLSYQLNKEEYFYSDDEDVRQKVFAKLQSLFVAIFINRYYDQEQLYKNYEEAVFIKNDRLSYYFLSEIIKRDQRDITLLESAYYLSNKLSREYEALNYLHLLQKYDRENRNKWLLAEYYLMIDKRHFDRAKDFLRELSRTSTFWSEHFGAFLLSQKEYEAASDVYVNLMHRADYANQKVYFKKSVDALRAGAQLKQAANRAAEYESRFIGDSSLRRYILKVYIECGDLKRATNLSKRILNGR